MDSSEHLFRVFGKLGFCPSRILQFLSTWQITGIEILQKKNWVQRSPVQNSMPRIQSGPLPRIRVCSRTVSILFFLPLALSFQSSGSLNFPGKVRRMLTSAEGCFSSPFQAQAVHFKLTQFGSTSNTNPTLLVCLS